MSVEDVLLKVVAGETLADEEIESLKSFKMPDVSAAKNEAAANARKKATEQHKSELAELQGKLSEYEEQIESFNDNGSDKEKSAKALEKLQKQLESLSASKAELEQQNASIQRNHAFDQVLSGLQFMDDSSKDLGRLKLETLLKDVEDLSFTDEVTPIISDFEKSYPALFVGASVPGTGTKNQGATAPSPSDPSKMTLEQRQNQLRENRPQGRR
jgi:DNA repair exonuclease SbcCD ATPase subunit